MYRKIFGIVFITLLYFLLVSQSYAASINFTKDSQNPLSTNFSLLQSTLLKDSNQYEMWFTGNNGSNFKIGYAASNNGTDWPTSTFVSLSEAGDQHDPSLLVHGENKYIYYVSEPSEGSGVYIEIMRSVVNDAQFSTPQLINLPRQSWNSQKLSCPYVYFENGGFSLFSCGTNGTSWSLGLAQSTDGLNFTPCGNNPIISGSTPGNSQLYVDKDGIKHLLFHSDNGIEEVTSTGTLNCNTNWSDRKTIISKDQPYDQSQIISPALVSGDSSSLELFYTARGPATAEEWKLNRAVENIDKPKIIIIPGFFASWNEDAILHNQTVNQTEWKIPSYIHEYEGLTKTLENLGLAANDDFYVFPYDWRKSLNSSADDLKQFLQTNIWDFDESSNVSLVGHSMGGLLSRIYGQKYPDQRLKTLITAGTPHRGVIQVYQPLEAGETKKDDTALWFGTKLLINLNRKNFSNDRLTVQTEIPSLYDLFPVFDFLKKQNGEFKPTSSLTIQNSTLNTYANLGSVADKMTVMYGNKAPNSSPLAYGLTNRALIDRLSGDYLDGRPLRTIYGPGDYLVPTVSSVIGDRTEELPLDHGEIIYSKPAISKILDALEISYQEDDVAEGSATKISPSLIITIQSPIEASVQLGTQTYYAENGIIFIPNAISGNYSLNVKKLQPGDYTITVAQVAQQNDVWEQFTGTIEERNVSEEDKYAIKYNKTVVKPQITTKSCYKYRRSFFNLRKRLLCRIKNLRIR